jgi:threonine synthase
LCVQQDTRARLVSARLAGSDVIRPEDIVHRAAGIADAILRGGTVSYVSVRLEMVMEDGGSFVAVSEQEIRMARRMVEELEG